MSEEPKSYRWSWLVLVLFMLGALLAVLWMMVEVKRTQRIRDLNNPPPAVSTNRIL